MNPTDFDNVEQVGAVIYKRLRQGVRAERLILLGTRDRADAGVWRGFLKAAAADGEHVVVLAKADADDAREADAPWETFALASESSTEDLRRQVTERMGPGRLVVVRGSTVELTHLVKDSLGRDLDSAIGHPVLAVSTLPFAVDESERNELAPCATSSDDAADRGRLSCAAARVARKFARKALRPERIWAVVERHGLKEYLAFVHLAP